MMVSSLVLEICAGEVNYHTPFYQEDMTYLFKAFRYWIVDI